MGDIRRITKGGKFLGWYIRYKDVDGKRKQRASHQPTRELARKMLVEIEARVARGLVGIPEQAPQAPLMSAVIERFLAEYRSPKIKHMPRYRALAAAALKRVMQWIDDKPIDQLNKRDIERARNALAADYRPNTVRSSIRFLSTLLNWAVREELLAISPLRNIDLPRAERSFEYLSAQEVGKLLDALEQKARSGKRRRWWPIYVGVVLALRLGLRRGEIFGLRWQDISPDTSPEFLTGELDRLKYPKD